MPLKSDQGTHDERGVARDADHLDAVLLRDGLERIELALAPAVGVAAERRGMEREHHLAALEGRERLSLEARAHEREVGGGVADRDDSLVRENDRRAGGGGGEVGERSELRAETRSAYER
jgi:hypothetical protein